MRFALREPQDDPEPVRGVNPVYGSPEAADGLPVKGKSDRLSLLRMACRGPQGIRSSGIAPIARFFWGVAKR